MTYLWVKAAHVASVLLFIGGLFVQSFAVASGRRADTGAMAIAGRWDRWVTTPAMLAVWLTGAVIAAEGGWFASPWLWAKLLFVLALTGLHGLQSGRLRRLRRGDPSLAGMQAVPVAPFVAFAAASIALLAVLKPVWPD